MYDSLAQIGQVIVLGKPAVLDTFETNAPSNGPVASSFASFGGSQDIDLRFGWCAQEYSICGFLFFAGPSKFAIKSCRNPWHGPQHGLGRKTSRMIRAWMANHDKAEEFALVELQLYNQISTGSPNSLRHVRGPWHFRPITRFDKLRLFPGGFRYQNGLLGYSIGSLLELTSANWSEGADHGLITTGFCDELSGSTSHPAAPTKPDNCQCDGSPQSAVQRRFYYIGSHDNGLS